MRHIVGYGIFATFVAGATACASQKVYAPTAPVVQARQGMLAGAKLAVGVYDARPDTAQFGVISQSIIDALRSAYPAVELIVLPPERTHADAARGQVTIRVAIAAHVADFGSKITPAIGLVGGTFILGAIPEGEWNGLSGFVVTVIDKRAGDSQPKVRSISKLVSKPNTWGYRTARSALDEAFRLNVQEALLYLDGVLAQ